MQLTEEQQTKLRQWVAEGCGLSEIQKRLREDCALALTYMDVRFLVLDLGIELKEKAQPTSAKAMNLGKPADAEQEPQDEPGPLDEAEAPEEPSPQAASVSVDIDRVLKPGALISGTVRFSDGVTASWALDQLGRLGLNVSRKGYRPSPADLQAFQQELSRLIQSRGM